MKVTSIPHIWYLLSWFVLLVFLPWVSIFLLKSSYAEGMKIPQGAYLGLGVTSTFGIFALIAFPTFFKLIRITDSEMKITFPLLPMKSKLYHLNEIVGFSVYNNWGRFVNYETIHFEMTDGNIYMIMQYEYFNYHKIQSFIVNNSQSKEISKYHNLKCTLSLFAIAIFLTVVLINVFNYSIK